MNNINQFQNEISNKYSHTNEYQDFIKNHNYDHDLKAKLLMDIFKEIGNSKELPVDSNKVQALIKKLHDYITNNYYTCSKEMLQNLGLMYVEDTRFKEKIDNVAGNGTSEFVNEAIKIYCK